MPYQVPYRCQGQILACWTTRPIPQRPGGADQREAAGAKPPAKTGRTSRGQALAEFAIILPLLLFMMLGVEELGRLAYTGIVVSNAAHSGALYGAQGSVTVVDDSAMVQAALADGGEVSGLSAAATHVCECASGGSAPNCALSDCPGSRLQVDAQVTATATFTPLCSLFGWPGAITLRSQATVEARP